MDIPEELQKYIDANVEKQVLTDETHTSLLAEKEQERRSSVEEHEIIAFQKEIEKKLKSQRPNLALRVKNGSYVITNYVVDDRSLSRNNDEEVGSGPRRAKQKIPTVATESPIFQLLTYLRTCLRGDSQMCQDQVVIMDEVNLAFEAGKMYLVL